MEDGNVGPFRRILEEDPPPFLDRVNTPWDEVPDFAEALRTYRDWLPATKRLRERCGQVKAGQSLRG